MTRESDPHFHDGNRYARHWGPQTNQEKHSCGDSDDTGANAIFKDSREDCRERGGFRQADNLMMNQDNGSEQPKKKKATPWPAVSECRE